MWTASAFKIVMMLLQFLAAILSFGVFYTKSSRIDNWIRGSPINRDMLMLLKNILREPQN
jgi:hypothetical protein